MQRRREAAQAAADAAAAAAALTAEPKDPPVHMRAVLHPDGSFGVAVEARALSRLLSVARCCFPGLPALMSALLAEGLGAAFNAAHSCRADVQEVLMCTAAFQLSRRAAHSSKPWTQLVHWCKD